MNLQPYEVALILGVVILALEMTTGVFICLSIAIGLFSVALTEFLLQDFQLVRDVLIFVFTAMAAFIGLRLVFRSKGDVKTAHKDVNDY
jgi:membrane protein implicated in regulation of membrane protease activity